MSYPGENHILEAKFETVADVYMNIALCSILKHIYAT